MINFYVLNCVALQCSEYGICLKAVSPSSEHSPSKAVLEDSGPVSYCFLSILLFTDEGRHLDFLSISTFCC